MAHTTTEQDREIILVNGVEKYQITITVLDKGDLPDIYLFLIEIRDTSDPKEDLFARVVTISDFEDYGTDRAAAVTAGETYYRVDTSVFVYDSLDVGVNAASVLKSRIDELVDDYQVYEASFEAVDEVTSHPQVDADLFNNAVEDYNEAVIAEAAAKTTRDTALDTYNTSVTDASTATDEVTAAQDRSDDCVKMKGYFDTLLTNFGTILSGGGTYRTAGLTFGGQAQSFLTDDCTGDPPTSGEKSTFQGQIDTFNTASGVFGTSLTDGQAQQTAASAQQAEIAAACSDLAAELAAAQVAKSDAEIAVRDSRIAYEDDQGAYEAAQSATEAALAAVRALKPDWDPNDQ